MSIGLKDGELDLLTKVFRNYIQIEKVFLYGSRALGTFKSSSDVDLAIKGDLDTTLLARVLEELEELPLPYKFDVLDISTVTHEGLIQHIKTYGVVIYQNQ